jgi:hypothetical protein
MPLIGFLSAASYRSSGGAAAWPLAARAWMWMSLAEPIEEARGSYEFPRGR